jgi:thioredoxin 1
MVQTVPRACADSRGRWAEWYAKSARVVKVNVDESPTVAQRYGIQGIPTDSFSGGRREGTIVGVMSREKASRTIEAYIDADLN